MRKWVKIAATAVSTDYRSPPPWSVKEEDGSFVVRDNNRQLDLILTSLIPALS
jgi:hypothetical protein